MMEIHNNLLNKYNIPVPRYTSYPPANHFKSDFSESDYIRLTQKVGINAPNHIAFYFHIPFCQQICFYCGCNSCKLTNQQTVENYIQAVKKEIKIVSRHIDKGKKVSQIHFGGGTPNAIDSSFISQINDLIYKEFSFIENPEIAIECNPAYLDFEYLGNLCDAGFRRYSFGIQDFNTKVLKDVNRKPSKIPVNEFVNFVKGLDDNIAVNLDFIYGLPGQSKESFSQTIKEAIKIKPDRLVTFSYAHVPWIKKNQKILEKLQIPGPSEKIDMFLSAYSLLTEGGYEPIGMDHYALPEDELSIALKNRKLNRNFQGYCTRRTTGQVYAFGTTAISQLAGGYAQNTKDIPTYIETVNKGQLPLSKGYILSKEQMIIKEVITEIMCNKYLSWDDITEKVHIKTSELKNIVGYSPESLDEFVKDDLVRANDEEIVVTERGSLFIRNIAALFDPAYQQQEKKYSKSV